MSDEECNPSNRDGCARYHKGAVQCFKMVNPRSAIFSEFWSFVCPYTMYIKCFKYVATFKIGGDGSFTWVLNSKVNSIFSGKQSCLLLWMGN